MTPQQLVEHCVQIIRVAGLLAHLLSDPTVVARFNDRPDIVRTHRELVRLLSRSGPTTDPTRGPTDSDPLDPHLDPPGGPTP